MFSVRQKANFYGDIVRMSCVVGKKVLNKKEITRHSDGIGNISLFVMRKREAKSFFSICVTQFVFLLIDFPVPASRLV